MYSFLVHEFNMETENLARLYMVVWKADKSDLNVWQRSTSRLCTLSSPYRLPGLVQNIFKDLRYFF